MPESQAPADLAVEVFPRLKERDPFKRLGIERDASFEEFQEARNFLVEQYRAHEPSREAIELAFDSVTPLTLSMTNARIAIINYWEKLKAEGQIDE